MSNTAQNSVATTESYWDKYGIPRVTLHEALAQIELSIIYNQTRGVFCLISEAGEGKSQGIHQLARKHRRRVVDIRTSQFSMIGAGVPQRADETGHFKIAIPNDYPKPGEKCLLVFDEINQGQQHAVALFFKLLEDRGIYDYTLPNDCIIVALMNPSTANYSVTKIETNSAFNRRLQKLYVYNTFSDWKKHAQTNDFHYTDGLQKPCHPMVVRLLTATPAMLYTAKDRDGNKQYACPATWQTVSLSLYNLADAGVDLTSERAENRIAASINIVNARMLVEFIKNNEILIGPEEVLFKYKPKSKLRERVLEIQKEPGGTYTQLVEDVAQYIFRERPEAEVIAPNLVQFWHDMPVEQAQPFYQMLDAACQAHGGIKEPKNVQYMQALTTANRQYPLWKEINDRINRIHDEVEKKIHGRGVGKDPMLSAQM
jgi:hypothetical protein